MLKWCCYFIAMIQYLKKIQKEYFFIICYFIIITFVKLCRIAKSVNKPESASGNIFCTCDLHSPRFFGLFRLIMVCTVHYSVNTDFGILPKNDGLKDGQVY
jgi:hypothetical protein